MPIEIISAKDLKIGHYVILKDIPWIQHPFIKNSFFITDERSLNTLKTYTQYTIYIDNEKSNTTTNSYYKEFKKSVKKTTKEDKKKKLSDLQKRKRQIHETEITFSRMQKTIGSITEKIFNKTIDYNTDIDEHVTSIAEPLYGSNNTAICLLNSEDIEESHYCHNMNVAVLSALLSKQVSNDDEFIKHAVIAGIFHDIGKQFIAPEIRSQMEHAQTFTPAQKVIYESHPFYAVKALSGMMEFPPTAMTAIYQHHETISGTGFPQGLTKPEVTPIAQILHMTNMYDNLINPKNIERKMPPHKALSLIYTQKKDLFDQDLLEHFIKMLGVYPPGSILKLEDNNVALVIEINEKDILDPGVVLYDSTIPKREAPILKLKKDIGLNIAQVISPEALTMEQKNYLSIRTTSIMGAYAD